MEYLIKKDWHYATPLELIKKACKIRYTKERSMSAVVNFNTDCIYEIGIDQSDINKLFGFSLGMHHTNSIRVGWRYYKGAMELCAYIYENGVRQKERVLWECDFFKDYKIDIKLKVVDNSYMVEFYVNDEFRYGKTLATKVKRRISYPLSLYFGGNRKCPHNMHIELKSSDSSKKLKISWFSR